LTDTDKTIKVKNIMLKWINEFDLLVQMPLSNLISTGKMLRARLILGIAGESIKAIKLSAIIEMIHLASLLHDDVIDKANTRRGKPTVSFSFGNKKAIMFGDLLYSKAYLELNHFEYKVIQSISSAVCQLSLGEILDEELSERFNPNSDIYMDMIYKKTASLIEASTYCAGVISNKDTNKLKIYGKNIGIAFQIIDDILDITASEEEFKKPVMQDFANGKSTISYIHLYNQSNNQEKSFILSCFNKKLNKIEGNKIKSLFTKYNSIEHSYKIANDLIKIAKNNALNDEFLISILDKIIKRVS
jgi:octaprenyl-diphosphate synthase